MKMKVKKVTDVQLLTLQYVCCNCSVISLNKHSLSGDTQQVLLFLQNLCDVNFISVTNCTHQEIMSELVIFIPSALLHSHFSPEVWLTTFGQLLRVKIKTLHRQTGSNRADPVFPLLIRLQQEGGFLFKLKLLYVCLTGSNKIKSVTKYLAALNNSKSPDTSQKYLQKKSCLSDTVNGVAILILERGSTVLLLLLLLLRHAQATPPGF